MQSNTCIVTDPEVIRYLQLCARYLAATLELKGMRHSSGRSMTQLLKKTYQLKGNRASVIAQVKAIKEQWALKLDERLVNRG